MYVSVSNGEVTLAEPEDTMSFKVVVRGTDDGVNDADLGRILRDTEWGRLDGDEAMISVQAVRRAVAGRVPADWTDRFDQMLDYARRKGWVASDGTAIRAHVERTGDAA